jgi:ADP-heptose:LPS heptosyltransferase
MNSHLNEPLLILTVGGLGDLLCAEPVIRFGVQEVFTESEKIVIVTKNKDIYKHFSNVDNLLFDSRISFITEEELYKDLKSYYGYAICTIYDHPLYKKKGFIQGAMHFTDYASIYLLGRLVPETKKGIFIQPASAEEQFLVEEKFENLGLDIRETLLIHPGETWPSRTIPEDWWEEFIKNYKDDMCLIGENRPVHIPLMTESPSKIPEETNEFHRNYTPGVLNLNTTIPSLIDQLSFKELVIAIDLCKGVITNDSLPVHIAGAVGNWMFTFATAREWDNLKPPGYSYGMFYNLATDCFYPAKHYRPTRLIGSVDLIPAPFKSIKEIILEPKSSVDFINQLWN